VLFDPIIAVTNLCLMCLTGTLWAFDLESNCDKTVVYAMRATALSGWLVLACLIIGIAVVFDPLGHVNHQQHSNIMMENTDGTAQRLWTLRSNLSLFQVIIINVKCKIYLINIINCFIYLNE